MGFDASSGERNTTGHYLETQALTFAGSTARTRNSQKMEEVGGYSRVCKPTPKLALNPATGAEGPFAAS